MGVMKYKPAHVARLHEQAQDEHNARAIGAYEKAGFAKARLVDTPDGIALLMVRDA